MAPLFYSKVIKSKNQLYSNCLRDADIHPIRRDRPLLQGTIRIYKSGCVKSIHSDDFDVFVCGLYCFLIYLAVHLKLKSCLE